ncbi:MAG: BrnT family toxin [Alphaproteobacteria bacterium]|jgi:uncharacterized DUF497 family protein|nr:BrnT family toxin [Alphaproteobacteria bacterium]
MFTWDEAKRLKTLSERGLDFANAGLVFAGWHYDTLDERHDYGETRYVTAGYLDRRFVIVIWTPRGRSKRIISMRYGHADEEADYKDLLG